MCTKRMIAAAFGLMVLATGAPAMAQSQPAAVSGGVTIAFGLSSLTENYGTGRGGEIDVQVADFRGHSPRGIALVFNGSVNRFDGFAETTVMGGLRFAFRRAATIRPFGQLLAGIERCNLCKTTDPTFEPAFGVDITLGRSGRLALRGLAGYRVTPSDGRTFKETHLLLGISVRPGRR